MVQRCLPLVDVLSPILCSDGDLTPDSFLFTLLLRSRSALGSISTGVEGSLENTECRSALKISKWDVVCPCIHWVVQNTKELLIHAVVFTLSAFLFFSQVKMHCKALSG
jgi:hypothetical protein